ncbi:MAG: sigma-70 family RNA polymerase sigma factor [Deltaproteobacteria bacterium]|nr:sigma-70 family RNA polymerase sigma factor [Deltaproteobacteria bacterium]MCW5805896.1 sigma-70 family RNA polymerase sigma factor [Deltaproteobacteria bacterium]
MKRDTTGSLAALDPADEADLIERCRADDRTAHDEFYHRFRRQVAGNLYRVLGDRTDLDDLVQEVFVIAFRGLERFRGDARLSTWLYRICVNVALGRIRTRKRRPNAVGMTDLDSAPADPSLTERPETPDRSLERRRDQESVYRALEELAPKKRIVLYLHEIEGLDLKEIAYLVDSNPVTVRTRLFYARREFYKIIAGDAALAGDEPAGAGEGDDA